MVNYTTIKVKEKTFKEFNKLKGHDGCVSSDDVLQFLLKKVKKNG